MATAELIIESLEWRAPFVIELPIDSSPQNLKDAISEIISSPSESIHLTLDMKHDLISSPMEYLGIAPGTKIYYTRYPNKLIDGKGEPPLVKKLSFPSFLSVLQRVCKQVSDNGTDDNDYILMMIAVHVMILDCGFVSFDIVTSKKIQTLRYATTRLITESRGDDRLFRTVNLKFEAFGKWVSVHRFLNWGNHGTFVWLDVERFVPSLKFVCMNPKNDVELLFHQREVFELWKIVVDGLKLGLVVDHFDKMTVGAPSQFMCLPADIRLKILEFLPGNDIAKVGCVCAELSHLSLEDDLWKNKCMEEFPHISLRELLMHQCKYKFALSWKQRKNSISWAL